MKLDLKNLPNNTAFLQHMIRDLVQEMTSLQNNNTVLQSENKTLHERNEYLENQLALLKAKRFGKSSEKLDTEQTDKLDKQIAEIEERLEDSELLHDLEESGEEDASQAKGKAKNQDVSREPKDKPKRKRPPEHLPREDRIINPDPICPDCGGTEFRKIADDVSEVLEYVPSSFKVIRNIRPRCACTSCEKIVQAVPASNAIDKGKAGPGLLAHIILQKYMSHLPFYRQSQIYGYEDIDLPRSTMAGWAGRCSRLLEPLIEEIRKVVFGAGQIHGDDTIVKVLAPGLGKTTTGRIWVYVKDGRPYGDKSPPAICYYYSPDRKGERPASHLKDFAGILHADAYAGYDHLYIGNPKNPDAKITEAACWAHTRRKFYEITQMHEKAQIAYETLEIMAQNQRGTT